MSQNKNINNEVSAPKVRHSTFDMGNTHVTSLNFGDIVPVYIEPTLPGSHWKMSTEWLLKASAMLAPVMHRNQVYAHTFYVPYRLVWPSWTDFITETKVGGVLPAIPFITFNWQDGNPDSVTPLANYMGIPFPSTVPGANKVRKVNAFWFACYNLIWNEFFRDENIFTELLTELIDGDNNSVIEQLTALQKRAWMHDYFTSALPDTQKGEPVNIPMTFDDTIVKWFDQVPGGDGILSTTNLGGATVFIDDDTPTANLSAATQHLFAKTSELLSSASIIDLRTAEQLQKFRETMMTHGSRYNEYLQAIYGYRINDNTIQRPIYLGGMRADLMISETLATTAVPAIDQPQGNKSGNGNSYAMGGDISYTCAEHGVIMTLLSVMPDSMYFQGVRKELMKVSDPYEFGVPLMANIGEQPIANEEIYAFQDEDDNGTFGYQQRYAEYKQTFNRISGDMTSSLLFWNQARNFATLPVLASDFVECNHANDDLDRIFNVEDAATQKLWVMIRTNAKVSQPLPYFGTPMLGQ